jgi:hypothetical protein
MVDVYAGQKLVVSQNANLESRIDVLEGMGPWYTLTITGSPYTNRSGSYAPSRYRMCPSWQHAVEVQLILTTSSGGSNGITLCTLPVGYRPIYMQNYPISGAGSSTINCPTIEVWTDGSIKLWDQATTGTNYHHANFFVYLN